MLLVSRLCNALLWSPNLNMHLLPGTARCVKCEQICVVTLQQIFMEYVEKSLETLRPKSVC